MTGAIAALYYHPIKGFTPQRVARAYLSTGAAFPGDRLFAVEDGPSGFDPLNPGFIPKQRFAVLAKSARVALARTDYDQASGRLTAQAPGAPSFDAVLTEPAGRAARCQRAPRPGLKTIRPKRSAGPDPRRQGRGP